MTDAAQSSQRSLTDILANRAARGTLREHVEDTLEQLILNGTLEPGDQLPPEARVAEALGVSRPVVREAMKSLQARGLVRIAQGKRIEVTERGAAETLGTLSVLLQHEADTMADLWEARVILETGVSRVASQRASAEHLRAMREAAEDFRDAIPDDAGRRVKADERFHQALTDATGNSVLRMLRTTIAALLHDALHTILSSPKIQADSEGHFRILDAVEERDADRAATAMLSHLEKAKADLIQATGKDWQTLCGHRAIDSAEMVSGSAALFDNMRG